MTPLLDRKNIGNTSTYLVHVKTLLSVMYKMTEPNSSATLMHLFIVMAFSVVMQICIIGIL